MTNNHPNILEVHGPNMEGRDFAIGDLHGAIDTLNMMLKGLGFDPTKDRLFSGGDLIDRGPDSLNCLRKIREPWFFAVKANHEDMAIGAIKGSPIGYAWDWNGGHWGQASVNIARNPDLRKSASEEELELIDLLNEADQLPLMRTITTRSGKKFHLLHAELPSVLSDNNVIVTDEDLADPEFVRSLALTDCASGDGEAFLWERSLFYHFYRADLGQREKVIRQLRYHNRYNIFNDKLSHIISGHTIMQRPATFVGQTNLDTCAYGSYNSSHHGGTVVKAKAWCALTAVELDTWKFYQATPYEFREVEPFVVTLADLQEEKPEIGRTAPPSIVDTIYLQSQQKADDK